MMSDSPEKAPQPSGHTKPWVLERMVHRAQPHLTETGIHLNTQWFIIGGVIVLMLFAFLLLYMWAGRTFGVSTVSETPASVRTTATVSAGARTVVVVTSTPATSATPGKTSTPALATPVPTPTVPVPPPTLPPAKARYKVQSGDTLSSIAIKYGVTVQAIVKANGLKNDIIRAGDELIIPSP